MRYLLISGFMLLLMACSGSSEQSGEPVWLSRPGQVYDAQQYLSAVGDGTTRQQAQERALANLSRVFEVSIAQQSLDLTRSSSQSQGGQRQSQAEVTVSRHISVEARQQLSGGEVPEVWQDADGRYYALAVLEKGPAARRFRQQISEADQQVTALVSYASQTAPNPVKALSALDQARDHQWQRENLNRDLMVVSLRGEPAPYSLADIDRLIRDGLASLRFAVVADTPEFETALKGAMGQVGIRVADPATANLVLSGSMDTSPVSYQQGWYWLRGAYQLSLSDSGDTLATRRWPMKVSSASQGMVHQRAKDQLVAKLPDYLFELLSSEP